MDEIATKIATEALKLQIQLNIITAELELQKETLRELANSKIMRIVVDNLGKIDVTVPRMGSEKVELDINEERLQKIPELREKLIEKGIAKQVLVVDRDKLIAAPD